MISHSQLGTHDAVQNSGRSPFQHYLPPYSPDLNPIEKLFAKLKALLRKAAKRSVDALWDHIGTLLDHISPEECANYFASSGYVCI
jgi:transposase